MARTVPPKVDSSAEGPGEHGERQVVEGTLGKARLRASKAPGSASTPPAYNGPERRKRRISFSGMDRRSEMR
jgi:hypothetical protein